MQRISVKNFMALEDVDIEINDLLILIGEQASGKSTISKLVYFFKSLRQDLIDVIYDDLDGQPEITKQLWPKIRNKFYNYFGSTRHLDDFQITYSYSDSKQVILSLKTDKSLDISFEPYDFYQSLFYGRITGLITEVKRYSNQENAYDRRAFQRSLGDLETYTEQIFHEHHAPLFLPAGRNISVNYPDQFRFEFYGNLRSDLARQEAITNLVSSSDLYLMTSFLEQIERIKQRFRANDFQGMISNKQSLGESVNSQALQQVIGYIENILRGTYRQDQYGEKIYYDAEKYVPLNNASSGQQEAIRILQDAFLIILDNESAFRVIEEPEAHLYPNAQRYLMETLAIMLNNSDSQLIITTHSPYILSVVNNLLFANRVANANPLASAEIEEILPRSVWLDSAKVSAYFLRGGNCDSIIDLSTGLIDQNVLDDISEELGADFQELYHIHARVFA